MSDINIKLEGMCEGCPYADLELDDPIHLIFGSEPYTEYRITCYHQQVCNAWEQKLNDLKVNKA